MKKNLLILILLISVSIRSETYNFARLDNTNGLSNNEIECIFKDSRGFVWFGTNFGLNRYDGYHVKVYQSVKRDTSSLPYNYIASIQEDLLGNLWLKGFSKYFVYDKISEKFIRNPSTILSTMGINFIPAIVEIDSQKNFYFYHANEGVYKYDFKLRKLFSYKQSGNANSLSKGLIICIKQVNGYFWVLFKSGLLERFNEKTNAVDFRNTHILESAKGSTIDKFFFLDSEGNPWVYPGLGDKGVSCFNFKKAQWIFFGSNKKDFKNSFDQIISSDFVRELKQDREGKIWIATDHGGINIYDKKNGDITVLRSDPMNPNSISQNSVISMFCDDTGIMWVGTYKNWVSYYHPGMFKFAKSPLFFYHNPNLETKDCNALCEDYKGNLWIGTNGGGLIKFNNYNRSFQLYRNQKEDPSSISSNIIISMLQDKKGAMWFGTFLGGLNQMKGEKFTRYMPDVNNPNSISNKSIYGLVEDKRENIWIATLGAGVDKLNSGRDFFQHFNPDNMPRMTTNVISSLYSGKSSLVYLSTIVGVNILNTELNTIYSIFKDSTQLNKLSDLIIYNTITDRHNQIWMATNSGLNVYNPTLNTISYINKRSGLPSEQVVSLVEDNRGNVWAGTRNGLARISCSLNQTTGKYDYSIFSFDENDGLQSAIFNQNAVFKNRDGNIYFGCTKGYTFFDPSAISFNTLVPKPRFTSFFIGKDEIKPDVKYKTGMFLDASITHKDKVELRYNENNFTIYFSAMSYIHPEKNRFRYKLLGFDEEWNETKSGIGSATYSNINQGTYELLVYASNNDKVWCTTPLRLKIVIRPPFWFAWWAIVFYALCSLALFWLIVNFNLRKQKRAFEAAQSMREATQLHEMDEMKFRFFTNISHEFRTPLTLILSPVEKMLSESKTEDEKKMLSIVQRNANGLLQLVNQLLDFRKLDVQKDSLNPSVGDIVAFIKDICYSFTEFANRKSISFSFSTSVSEFRMEFDSEKIQKIVSNLLSNAFKFTLGGGKIDVSMSLLQQLNDNRNLLKITVSDSGVGIPAKDLNRVFERFYRVENSGNWHQTGTGVGLHIVSEYVKLHKGEITVESIPGKGSVFTVLIPANQVIHEEIIAQAVQIEEEAEVISTEDAMMAESEKSKMPLMMIVDDNEDFRNFISALFISNFRILKANDGEMAFKMILERLPDIIICDVMMPKMDGFELCRQVKQDIRISHIPIILLTAKAGEENKYHGLEAGAEDYIAKPFNMDMLSLKVSRIIERQKLVREQFKRKIEINPSEIQITTMDEKFVKKAVALVEANISNTEFLVEDLCREMGMSRVYFYKKIRSLTDKTPSELIRFIRLKRAADLLEKSQLFVSEIAFQVGFNDPKYFRKYFKDEFGISPNEYKKKFIS